MLSKETEHTTLIFRRTGLPLGFALCKDAIYFLRR